MTDQELINLIREKPNSAEACAYRLGRKIMALELSQAIENVGLENHTLYKKTVSEMAKCLPKKHR